MSTRFKSLGGHVATLLANRYPEKIAGLLISGASMNFSGLTGLWTRFAGWLMLHAFKEDKLREQAARSIRRKWPKETGEAAITAGIFPYGAAQSFLELPRVDFRALLVDIPAPVLILNGEHDRPNRRGEATFATAAPNSQVAVIRNAGHACSIEQPQAFNEHLLAFLRKLNGTK